jgi:RNA polymerase sigma-70 factor (ECF subfamily)
MSDDEDHPPDADLAAQAASGDEDAFSKLFDRYYSRIRAFAYQILLDYGTAEDVAQETFIRAAKGISSLHDKRTLQVWIYQICANTARDSLRAKRAHDIKLEQAAQHFETARECRSGDETTERALHLLQSLPSDQREAVALVFFEEFSHAEAAQRLGCAVSTISWRIHLAKRRLRKLMKS